MKTLTREDLLSIFLTTDPTAKSPYGLYGYPPMWELLQVSDRISLFARPSRTMARPYPEDPYREVDGIQYQFQVDGKWWDQASSCTYERFLSHYQERCRAVLEKFA